jgi:DNA-binding sugar fermentation-stimulating protein
MSIILHKLSEITKGKIINRPSKKIKSPYVADVLLLDGSNKIVLGHTAALGCCGLADKGSIVYMTKSNETSKCDYTIQYGQIIDIKKRYIKEKQKTNKSIIEGKIVKVGIAPKLAETIAGNALRNNLIEDLKVKTLEREKKFLNSRFDFIGTTIEGTKFILEVKNVPLADYEDIDSKERKNRKIETNNYENRKWDDKIAYFPDGYRKKKTDTVSPRALKHVNELKQLKKENPELRTILLFVVQRKDVSSFQPSNIDPIYRDAVKEAVIAGVEIKTIVVNWKSNKCYFYRNNLPVTL